MKKIVVSILSLVLIVGVNSSFADARVCESLYSTINGARYFSGLHCTENIQLSGVVVDEKALKDVSQRTINDFIISNNNKIIEYVDEGNVCNEISELEEIKKFEDVIYSNNDISYSETTTQVESLTESITELMEQYNDPQLYNDVSDSVKEQFPVGSVNFHTAETRQQYFDKQLEIKDDILGKQKEKLTLLFKLSESQKFIEGFYKQVNRICDGYYEERWGKATKEEREKALETDEEAEEVEELRKIEVYKDEFNQKLGATLDAMPQQSLKQLSVKLLDYAANSPIFKRFSDAQREIVNLKIKALKEAIDDRIEN